MYDPYFKRSVCTDSEKCNVYSVSDRGDRLVGNTSGDCHKVGVGMVKGPRRDKIWSRVVEREMKIRFYL